MVHAGFGEAVSIEHQVNELEAELGEMHFVASLLTELGERHFVASLLIYLLTLGLVTDFSLSMTSHFAE